MRADGRYFEDWLDRLLVMGKIGVEDWMRENGKFFELNTLSAVLNGTSGYIAWA
jgi:hypothetical protein